MLTLKSAQIPTLEIELTDGECIHVLPATKRIIEEMGGLDLKNIDIGMMYGLLAKILSYNREKRTVTEEDLAEVPLTAIREIMEEYTAFIKGKVAGAKN